MTITRQQRNGETNETPNSSNGFSERQRLLKTCQAMFAKELTEDEVRVWIEFLRDFSLSELRYAFENWTRNGRFFPKPRDIADQCESFRVQQRKTVGYPGCDTECKSRHFNGYGENDVKWLLKRYEAMKDSLPNRPMTDGEINNLLTELDSKREGGPPAWRSRH